MLFENVNISSYAASSVGLVSSVASSRVHICYLTGSVLNDIWIFRKLFYHGCFEVLPLAVRHSMWFQHKVASTWYGESFLYRFNWMYRKKVDWNLRANWKAFLLAGSKPDAFLYVDTWRSVFRQRFSSLASMSYKYLRQISTVTANVFRRALPSLLSAFKRGADASKICFKYEASMVWSSLSCPIWRYILFFEIKDQNIFSVTFQTYLRWNHIMEILWANLISLCKIRF